MEAGQRNIGKLIKRNYIIRLHFYKIKDKGFRVLGID